MAGNRPKEKPGGTGDPPKSHLYNMRAPSSRGENRAKFFKRRLRRPVARPLLFLAHRARSVTPATHENVQGYPDYELPVPGQAPLGYINRKKNHAAHRDSGIPQTSPIKDPRRASEPTADSGAKTESAMAKVNLPLWILERLQVESSNADQIEDALLEYCKARSCDHDCAAGECSHSISEFIAAVAELNELRAQHKSQNCPRWGPDDMDFRLDEAKAAARVINALRPLLMALTEDNEFQPPPRDGWFVRPPGSRAITTFLSLSLSLDYELAEMECVLAQMERLRTNEATMAGFLVVDLPALERAFDRWFIPYKLTSLLPYPALNHLEIRSTLFGHITESALKADLPGLATGECTKEMVDDWVERQFDRMVVDGRMWWKPRRSGDVPRTPPNQQGGWPQPAFGGNGNLGLRGGALNKAGQSYEKLATSSNSKRNSQRSPQAQAGVQPEGMLLSDRRRQQSASKKHPHNHATSGPAGRQPLGQMDQGARHRERQIVAEKTAASNAGSGHDVKIENNPPRPGGPTPASDSSSPFQAVVSDQESSARKEALLRTPLKQKLSDMPKSLPASKAETSSSIGRPYVDRGEVQDKASWAATGYVEDDGGRATPPAIPPRSKDRPSRINLGIFAPQASKPELSSLTVGRNLFSSGHKECLVVSPPSSQVMFAFGDGTPSLPVQLPANVDVGSKTAPSDSEITSASNTKTSYTNLKSTFSRKKTKSQLNNNNNLSMADKSSTPKANNTGGSGGHSIFNRKTTLPREDSTQARFSNTTRPKRKTSSIGQASESTTAKQLMPQLTSQRKYNPRSSLGGLGGHLRAPASQPTVAMSNVTAATSVPAMNIESKAFYNLLWPGCNFSPLQNSGGVMFQKLHPQARNEEYLRQYGTTPRQEFLKQFGRDKVADYANFMAAWDMVEAKYGKPGQGQYTDHNSSLPTLPAPPVPVAIGPAGQSGLDAGLKKTPAQQIVSGFKKSISKTGLSNLAKMPSMMSLPLKDNQGGRSTSGPAAFEISKPARTQSPSEIFVQNPLYPDDDFRAVRDARSKVQWAGRFTTLNERRMNDPEEFAESMKLAVELSKKSEGGRDKEDYQQQWDQNWDEKAVARALDVFNELHEWCKTVEARRSLKEYKIHLAREKGWHVLLPAGVPMKEPPASGMAKMAGKVMGKGDMSIKEMQLQFKEKRECDKFGASLNKQSTLRSTFKPRRSNLGLYETGIPGYGNGIPAELPPSYIPVPKGGSPTPRVYTPQRASYASSPLQQTGEGKGSGGRTWYGRKRPAGDDTPRPKAKENENPASSAAKAAMR